MENKNYRASFILDSRNYQDSIESLIQKIAQAIESLGAKVGKIDNLGTKEFSRVTEKTFTEGIFVTYQCTASVAFPHALREKLKLDKQVYRIFVENI